MKKNILLLTLIVMLFFSCSAEDKTGKIDFVSMGEVSFNVPGEIEQITYRENSVLEDMFLKEYFEVVGLDEEGNKNVLFQKDRLFSYYVYGQESYAYFQDIDHKDYRLGSLYYFLGAQGKGYKIMEPVNVFSISPDFLFLLKAVNDRHKDFANEFKAQLIQLPSGELLAEYDFYDDIDAFPAYEAANTIYYFSEDQKSVDVVFTDPWDEEFASFTINLEDYSYKQHEVNYSKKTESTPEDAVFVDRHSYMISTSQRIGDGNTRISWYLPVKYLFELKRRPDEDSEFETILSFPDTYLYLYNEEKGIVVLFHKDQDDSDRKNDITFLDLNTLEYGPIGRGSFKTIMTEDWHYLAYHEFSHVPESQLDYDSVIQIYDMRTRKIVATIDPNEYLPENYLDPNVDYVSFDYPKMELLITGVTPEDYLITVDIETGRHGSMEVNQYPRPESDLPSIK